MANFTFDRLRRRVHIGTIVLAGALFGPSAPRCWGSDHRAEDAEAESDAAGEESASGFRGIELGKFKIRTFHAVSSRKDGVSFTLHATIRSDDYKEFERL